MIPKKIHYIWLGGKPMPEEYLRYIEGWKRLNPSWEIIEWNEKNFDLSPSPYARQALEAGKFGFVSDYIRVCVLAEQGGIYLDTDVEVLRPLDGLCSLDMFMGFENDAYIATSAMGSSPGHPLLIAMKEFYERADFLKKGKPDLTPNTSYFTFLLNRDWKLPLYSGDYELTLSDRQIRIFPREILSPIDFNSHEDMRTEMTYTVHHFANSWASKSLLTGEAILNGVRKVCGKRLFSWFTRQYTRSFCRKLKKRGL